MTTTRLDVEEEAAILRKQNVQLKRLIRILTRKVNRLEKRVIEQVKEKENGL